MELVLEGVTVGLYKFEGSGYNTMIAFKNEKPWKCSPNAVWFIVKKNLQGDFEIHNNKAYQGHLLTDMDELKSELGKNGILASEFRGIPTIWNDQIGIFVGVNVRGDGSQEVFPYTKLLNTEHYVANMTYFVTERYKDIEELNDAQAKNWASEILTREEGLDLEESALYNQKMELLKPELSFLKITADESKLIDCVKRDADREANLQLAILKGDAVSLALKDREGNDYVVSGSQYLEGMTWIDAENMFRKVKYSATNFATIYADIEQLEDVELVEIDPEGKELGPVTISVSQFEALYRLHVTKELDDEIYYNHQYPQYAADFNLGVISTLELETVSRRKFMVSKEEFVKLYSAILSKKNDVKNEYRTKREELQAASNKEAIEVVALFIKTKRNERQRRLDQISRRNR